MYVSSSTPVSADFAVIATGILPKKLPIPIEVSRTFPPLKPNLLRPLYIASTTFVGVKNALFIESCTFFRCTPSKYLLNLEYCSYGRRLVSIPPHPLYFASISFSSFVASRPSSSNFKSNSIASRLSFALGGVVSYFSAKSSLITKLFLLDGNFSFLTVFAPVSITSGVSSVLSFNCPGCPPIP